MRRDLGPAGVALALTLAAGARSGPAAGAAVDDLPEGTWSEREIRPILEKTLTLRLDPDLSALSAGERVAVEKLLEVGRIFQTIYEESTHADAVAAHEQLLAWDQRLGSPPRTQQLLDLYRLFEGPIATTLDNRRVPFLPVGPEVPGKNVYPAGATKASLDAFLAANPAARPAILHVRTVVRGDDPETARRDRAALDRHPVLDTLHPGLREALDDAVAEPAAEPYRAVPYSVAYADDILRAYTLLNEAADAVETDDIEFARYLRLRSRDLLCDDYEAGDAVWVTSRFQNLNAQIGSYETYADELFGVKSFFSLSLLIRDRARTEELRTALANIQQIEDALPYSDHKTVRQDIPVGVYDVIADFGQARGTNTATILPNEAYISHLFGRTILLRSNILTNPRLFAMAQAEFAAAVVPEHRDDLALDGDFYRTLWHEVGHYLGVERTKNGEDLDVALQETSDALEEMKADLVSLFAAEALHASGAYDDARLRGVYAGGIRRVLQKVRPRPNQPYQTMELMQWNYFLEKGLLEFDPQAQALRIHYDRYHAVVTDLLAEILALQRAGDAEAARAFIARYSIWKDDLHEVIASRMRQAETYRYRLVRYAALGE
jgi:hypothetical protein